MNKSMRMITAITIAFLLLTACAPKVKTVQPIRGLPEGTDGYPWWNDTVFYEIFVRSFYDSNGDGVGDFNGIIQKMDYLNDGNPLTGTDLGVSGIWLMPVNPSPSYHGYDISDYYAVNPAYGTLDDFRRLIKEAHQRGIRVIMDLVLNHTSVKHPWFIEARDNPQSARHDWYIWSATDPGYLGPWNERVWFPSVAGYYYAVFGVSLPDLNYRNSAVTDEMDKVARFWLEDVGVDGFRLDAARYLIEDGKDQADTPPTLQWWASFRKLYKEINPQIMTVGEVWTTNYAVKKYVGSDELDMAFNFDLAKQTLSNVDNRTAANLGAVIRSSYSLFPRGTYATFLSNHDQERVMSYFMGEPGKARLSASVLLTAPGTPFIYYGEEIGMTGDKPDEKIRTPMGWSADKNAGFSTIYPWETINSNYTDVNVAVETVDPDSLLSLYRSLIGLRNDHAALRVGDYTWVQSDNASVLAFLRTSKNETLLVMINMAEKPASGMTLMLAQGPLSGQYRLLPLEGGAKMSDLTANSAGGFDNYTISAEIPADGLLIIQMQKR